MPRTVGPLGLLAPNIDQQIVDKISAAANTDLSLITGVLAATRAEYIPLEETDTVVRDLKRFLSLNLLVPDPDYSFVPSFKVDLAWHEFILYTRDYMEFCENLVGHYIHHAPEKSRAISRSRVAGEPFFYTKRKLQEFYGATPPFIWGIPVACDSGAVCNSHILRA